MASGKLTIETASSTVGINLPLHPAENLPQGTVGDVCYVKSSNTAGSLYLYTPNADGSANNWVNTAPGDSSPPGTASNPASSPKAIRDAGITARELADIADIKDIDGPAQQLVEKLIAGLELSLIHI